MAFPSLEAFDSRQGAKSDFNQQVETSGARDQVSLDAGLQYDVGMVKNITWSTNVGLFNVTC